MSRPLTIPYCSQTSCYKFLVMMYSLWQNAMNTLQNYLKPNLISVHILNLTDHN